MKFNSQICTTREQSERLLVLGLKKETADMYHSYDIICAKPYYKVMEFMNGCAPEVIFPAWSLHRLIEMIDDEFVIHLNNFTISGHVFGVYNNLYDNIVEFITYLIKEGYFNKEYLV